MAIPTQLKIARMPQINAARAMANSPQVLGGSTPFYGSDPERLERLRKRRSEDISSSREILGLKSSFEEYERQKKFQPQEDELKRLRLEQEKAFLPQESRLGQLRLEQEEQELRSKMAFRPLMDQMRMGMMQRMGGRFGVTAPSGVSGFGATSGFGSMAGGPQPASPTYTIGGQLSLPFGQGGALGGGMATQSPFAAGSPTTPSTQFVPAPWMRNFQSPQFPRY